MVDFQNKKILTVGGDLSSDSTANHIDLFFVLINRISRGHSLLTNFLPLYPSVPAADSQVMVAITWLMMGTRTAFHITKQYLLFDDEKHHH